MSERSTAAIEDVPSESRFVLRENGALAELQYRVRGDRFVLVHTEVPDALGGRGIGGQLVRAAIARAVVDGLVVVPVCSFARKWLEDHPDDAAAVTIDWDTK